MLPQVDGKVRDPPRVRLVMAQRPGPERTAHPLHDLGGRRLDERPHPQGPRPAAFSRSPGSASISPAAVSSMVLAVCSAMSKRRGGPGHADRCHVQPPRPAGSCRCLAPRRTSRPRHRRRRARNQAGRYRCRARRPGSRDVHEPTSKVSLAAIPTAGQLPGTGERSRVLTAKRQLPRASPRSPAHRCRNGRRNSTVYAVQAPAIAGLARFKPGAGRLRGPDTPATSSWRWADPSSAKMARASACPSASRQGEIFLGQVRETAQRSRVRPQPGSGRFSLPDFTE